MIMVANSIQLPIINSCGYLIFCDPPRNRGMNTRVADDTKSYQELQEFTIAWMREVQRISRWDSWLIIVTDYRSRKLIERLAPQHLMHRFYQEIIWDYGFGLYTTSRFVPSHDNILIYKSGNPSWYPEQIKIKSQRMKTLDARANWSGRIPSTVWRIPRVQGTSKERAHLTPDPNDRRTTLPRSLCKRIIKAYTSNKSSYHQLVVDPFCGSGIMEDVCKRLGRKVVSFDIAEQYCREAKSRADLSPR